MFEPSKQKKFGAKSWFFLAHQAVGMLGKKLIFQVPKGGQIWKW